MNDIAQNNVGMIDEKEAMRMIKVSSRMTISKYTKLYNFPNQSELTPNNTFSLRWYSGS